MSERDVVSEPGAEAMERAERAVSNGECGAQLEIADSILRISLVLNIAYALEAERIAERERCAKVVEDENWDAVYVGRYGKEMDFEATVVAIAAAIRLAAPAPKEVKR